MYIKKITGVFGLDSVKFIGEKQLPMYFGLEQLNYKRITEYMKIAELIIEEVLNSIIITFYNNEQEERLKAIIMAEGIFNNEMDMEIERWGEKIIKV